MAPMLGRKLFPLVNKVSEPLKPGDEIYTIEHSNETFTDKEEYEARLQLYGRQIWTCKSTGSSKLTHKEAWDQEQKISKLLQKKFQSCFEKPVLEIIHHSTIALEQLVEVIYREIMTQYVVNEECIFLDGNGKCMQVNIIKVFPSEKSDQEPTEKKAECASDTSSVDKSRTDQMGSDNCIKEPSGEEESGLIESQIDCLSEQPLHSPKKHLTSLKKQEKKWPLTKFLPLKYDVKLQNEGSTISGVPTNSLLRLESPPNKEILRCFIRHYALHIGTGANAHWVVENELVKRYSLPRKFGYFKQDPDKSIAHNSQPVTSTKKRKTLVFPGKMPASIIKVKKDENINIEENKQKNTSQDVKDVGYPYNLDSVQFPNKCLLLPRKKMMKVQKTKDLNRQMFVKLKTPKKGVKNPKIKKTTTMDMANNSPALSRTPTRAIVTHLIPKGLHKKGSSIVLRLIAFYRENKDRKDRKAYLSSLITKAVRLLTNDDRAILPEDLRVLVEKRHEKIQQKQKLASMTEEERKEFLREKDNELKEKMREKAKQRREKELQKKVEKRWRFEDQDLFGKSLPTFKLVKTPQELPNTLFGDVVMVVEFLNCYSQLLMPDEKYQVNAFTLMEALTAGTGGFLYLNCVLMTLLQTLLQDKIAKNYVDLGMKVSDIPLTLYSVSDMVRLCLLNSEVEDGNEDFSQRDNAEDSKDYSRFESNMVENEFLQKLEISEYFDLTAEGKLSIMVSLCHRIVSTHSVHDYVEEEQQRSAKISKQQQAMKKEAINVAKKKEDNDKELKPDVSNKEVEEEDVNRDFKKKEVENIDVKIEDHIDLETEDMISAVKRRRLLLMQANTVKEEKDRQQKEKLEKEAKQEQVHKQKVKLEKALHESIEKAKLVLRRSPLGTDRNHNRYWLFSNDVPGLFIERGWIHDSINYTCSSSHKEFNREECDQDSEDNMQMDGELGTVVTRASPAETETTVPVQENNLWFICDTQKEFDELLDCLHHQGIRESELKECLHKRYQDIVHSICMAHKPNPILKYCDGQQELLNFLRIDIIEMAKRLCKAGLGYLDETTIFEARVYSADSLKDFGDILIMLQASVGKRFLQGFLAPKQMSPSENSNIKTQKVDGKNSLTKEAKVSSEVEKWKGALNNAKTFSRMHVLLGMLDVCIRWDMSSENARCKVCSKKGEDVQLILCDKCNKAFHLFCLRPAIYVIPGGEWLCPACQPSTARYSTRIRNYTKDSTEEQDEDYEEHSDDDDDDVDSDYEVEEDEDENDYPHLMELKVSSRKTPKTQKIRASNVRCTEQPPMKKSKIVVVDASPCSSTSLVNGSDIDDLVNQSKSTQPQSLQLQLCQDILNKLIDYEFSWPFREPLICEQNKVYAEIDINPMDFMIMLCKCTCNMYHTVDEFLEDIKLVFCYAELYSHNRNYVNTCLENTENYLVSLLHKHLPAHTYQRLKQRKRPAKHVTPPGDEMDAEGNDHCIEKSKKKITSSDSECGGLK